MPEIILKPGREKSVLRRHPWIFSGAIALIKGSPGLGETVDVLSSSGEFLARAGYNPHSNISGRIWTWDENENIDPSFFERRLASSIKFRSEISGFISSNAMRLVHAESDGLPGLIVDKYDEVYVIQLLTAGIEFWKSSLIDILHHQLGAKIIYERSDADVRQLEGLPLSNGLRVGELTLNPIGIVEHEAKFLVDIVEGHKTGFYLDQRDNRYLARQVAYEKRVLDCFAYTGGFAVNCLLGGANQVIIVDSSKSALNLAKVNLKNNDQDINQVDFIDDDVFTYLRTLRDKGETFDLIILDPPKFAPTASQAERAARGYKDINLLALKILNKGGYLLTFSCSGGVSEDLFQKIVSGSALDAGVEAIILKRLHQAADHPVALNFPEGAYLKGFLIHKLS